MDTGLTGLLLLVIILLVVSVLGWQFKIFRLEKKIMSTLSEVKAKVDDLKNRVEAGITIEQSAVTLITGMAATEADLAVKLQAAIDANDPVALQAIADELDATANEHQTSSDTLAAAVAANTPAVQP